MTENWSMVRGQYCWKWQFRTVVDSKTWQIWYLMAIWLTNQNDNKIQLAFNAIRGSWQTFGDSSQFSWFSGRKDGEGMKLIFIFLSCINSYICVLSQLIFVSYHSCSSTRWGARRCKREEVLSATWSRYVPSEKQGQIFWPSQNVGNMYILSEK